MILTSPQFSLIVFVKYVMIFVINYMLSFNETQSLISKNTSQCQGKKDTTQLNYNDYLVLDGIPAEVYDYRLGNRSTLEWVVDQYRVKVDKRSGSINDPNRADQQRYIVDLIVRVVAVSLETVKIVKKLSAV